MAGAGELDSESCKIKKTQFITFLLFRKHIDHSTVDYASFVPIRIQSFGMN